MTAPAPHSNRERRRTGWLERTQAWCITAASERHARRLDDRKRALLGALEGRVLEIGPGSGVNLPCYADTVEWVGAEPSAPMREALVRQSKRIGRAIELIDDPAERLPLADGSVDAVVSTLVLCSVNDPKAALREIRRVLRPGGRFVFVEHVAAPQGTMLRRLQRLLRAPWKLAGGGCHPDRETWKAIEEAGFRHVTMEHFRVGVPIVSPHIAGVAER